MKLISVFYDWQAWITEDNKLMIYSDQSSTSQYIEDVMPEGQFEHHVDESSSTTVFFGQYSPVRKWLHAVMQAKEQADEERQVE